MEEIARKYEEEEGVPIQLQFGASNTLLVNAEVSRVGDLYLPADDTYLDFAAAKKLLAERVPLACMTPVLAVHKGNPKNIHSLDDVLNSEAKVAQANPDAAAIGRLSRTVLQDNGLWEKFEKRAIVTKGTVNDVANDIALGSVDAGIVWDVTVWQYPDLEAVGVPILNARPSHVSLGVLTTSDQSAAALRFAHYVAAGDRGLVILREMGYNPEEGEPWKPTK